MYSYQIYAIADNSDRFILYHIDGINDQLNKYRYVLDSKHEYLLFVTDETEPSAIFTGKVVVFSHLMNALREDLPERTCGKALWYSPSFIYHLKTAPKAA